MLIDLVQVSRGLSGHLDTGDRVRQFSGAHARRSGIGQVILAGSADVIAWQTEIYDFGGWWTPGDPTVFTVPAGVTRIRTFINIRLISALFAVGDSVRIRPLLNGVINNSVGAAAYRLTTTLANTHQWNIATPAYAVTPGDTIAAEVDAFLITEPQLTVVGGAAGTSMGVEVVT